MALVALTTITHGKDDGERVTVPEGEKVPGGLFTKDQLKNLHDEGLIGEPPATPSEVADTEAENADLKAKVEALEAELAAAREPKK